MLHCRGAVSGENDPLVGIKRFLEELGRSWSSRIQMVMCMFQSHSVNSSPPLLPPPRLWPQVCFLCLHLSSCPANRFISIIFRDSMLTHTHHHMQNRELVGSCYITQGAQPSALGQPRGVEWSGWGLGGRFKRKRTCVYLWLMHFVAWQKPIQHCIAIILQLKIN